jgi:hypothetical protein
MAPSRHQNVFGRAERWPYSKWRKDLKRERSWRKRRRDPRVQRSPEKQRRHWHDGSEAGVADLELVTNAILAARPRRRSLTSQCIKERLKLVITRPLRQGNVCDVDPRPHDPASSIDRLRWPFANTDHAMAGIFSLRKKDVSKQPASGRMMPPVRCPRRPARVPDAPPSAMRELPI